MDEPLTTATYSSTSTLQPGEQQTVAVYGLFPLSATHFYGHQVAVDANVTFVGFGPFQRVPYEQCPAVGYIHDGRINAYDLAAPLAAYCTADHGMEVWDIDDSGQGTLAFTVTQDQITKGLSDAAASGHNVLIGQGLGDSLYALASNQLTLVGPDIKESAKTYEFVTTGDRCG